MCGRFTDQHSWDEIKALYDLTAQYFASNFPPRHNIAPTQTSFVVREIKGMRELAELRWGAFCPNGRKRLLTAHG